MKEYTLITGASGGIGSELSKELSKKSRLVLSGLHYEKLENLRGRLENPDQHKIWAIDLAHNRQGIFSLLNEFMNREEVFINSFVHCAGITKILPLRSFKTEYVNQIFNINLFSAIEILRVLLKKRNSEALSNVLFISALWSIRGNVGNSVYAASKGAINSLVFSLTQELAPKVRVNSLLPGSIITPMSENLDKDYLEKLNNETPLGSGTVADVVNYACFLLSENAKWITGQNIVVDGGGSTK